jgi:hypothetical protein
MQEVAQEIGFDDQFYFSPIIPSPFKDGADSLSPGVFPGAIGTPLNLVSAGIAPAAARP